MGFWGRNARIMVSSEQHGERRKKGIRGSAVSSEKNEHPMRKSTPPPVLQIGPYGTSLYFLDGQRQVPEPNISLDLACIGELEHVYNFENYATVWTTAVRMMMSSCQRIV